MGPYYPGGPAPWVKREEPDAARHDGLATKPVPRLSNPVSERKATTTDRRFPMRRTALVPLALVALLTLVTPIPSSAHSHPSAHAYSFGFSNDEDKDFGWAVVSDGNTNCTNLSDSDVINELKDRYDGDFLYVRDGKDQFVIRDPRLVERALTASREISKYGREIGKFASAQAKLALSRVGMTGQRLSLERAERELEREIERSEREGESTQGLKRALGHIREELKALPDEDENTGLSASERDDLRRQSDEARKHLQDAVRKMRRDIRDILREAKERGKAEKLDAKDMKSF